MPYDAAAPAPMLGEKHRLRFEKTGDLRFLSHLDLMRSIERLCRRAQIPLRFSQGFHPAPRIVFALSLPLGVSGRNEVLEIETSEPLESNDVLERVQTHSPKGLRFFQVATLGLKQQAVPRRAVYRLELFAGQAEIADANGRTLLNSERVWAPRQKPRPRQVNIRPYLRAISASPESLTMDFWVTPYGTARADEVIDLLGLPSPFDTGATIERLDLELLDEAPAAASDAPPEGTPELKPLDTPANASFAEHEPATATWGLSPNGPVVE